MKISSGLDSIELTPKAENMIIQFIKKEHLGYLEDETFVKNFMEDFNKELPNCLVQFRSGLWVEIKNIDTCFDVLMTMGMDKSKVLRWKENILNDSLDFANIIMYIQREKVKREALTKEERKALTKKRKMIREALKDKYGYVKLDGKIVSIANYIVEPPSIFMGRGTNPKRGKWKEAVIHKDIILNLSPKSPVPEGKWKKIEFHPDKTWIAKWKDPFSKKWKYVWCSDDAPFKQDREKVKYDKAIQLSKKIGTVRKYIATNLKSRTNWKLALICDIIDKLNIRVGDEKEEGDTDDTYGATTLKKEHIQIHSDDKIEFNFKGKDSVEWSGSKVFSPLAVKRLSKLMNTANGDALFEGITSKEISDFLSKKMKGLTAKVFRTYKATMKVKEILEKYPVSKNDPTYYKQYVIKTANLEAARVSNHKKKISPKFQERLVKKQWKLNNTRCKLDIVKNIRVTKVPFQRTARDLKRISTLENRVRKYEYDLRLYRATKELNLGTSRNSYIDPRVVMNFCKEVDLETKKFYSKKQREKFSWAG